MSLSSVKLELVKSNECLGNSLTNTINPNYQRLKTILENFPDPYDPTQCYVLALSGNCDFFWKNLEDPAGCVPQTQTYAFEQQDATILVPTWANRVDFELWGAGGAHGGSVGSHGGAGGYSTGTFAVNSGGLINAGDNLGILVGRPGIVHGAGGYGFGGDGSAFGSGGHSGGGGGTFIYTEGSVLTSAEQARVILAAGGGGAGTAANGGNIEIGEGGNGSGGEVTMQGQTASGFSAGAGGGGYQGGSMSSGAINAGLGGTGFAEATNVSSNFQMSNTNIPPGTGSGNYVSGKGRGAIDDLDPATEGLAIVTFRKDCSV